MRIICIKRRRGQSLMLSHPHLFMIKLFINLTYYRVRLSQSLAFLMLLCWLPMSWALTVPATKDLTCAGFRQSTDLNCTAGEFTVSPTFSAAPGTPPFCIAGQAFNFQIDLRLSGSNANRFDIGFFVGQNGNDPRLSTSGNICSVATFPNNTSPEVTPWYNADGNACGDYTAAGDYTQTINEIKVVCQSTGTATSDLAIPYVVTYRQNTGGN